jgi:UDP-N-acetylglucosamine 2-epimerase (non-hydrolysing)
MPELRGQRDHARHRVRGAGRLDARRARNNARPLATYHRSAMRAVNHVMSVVGTRPNFMKTAPVIAALARSARRVRHTLVHTGQHYDDAMSRVFVEQLGVGEPDHMLDVGSGTHAAQTARVMERIEPILEQERPDILLVPGDVNSTVAAALVAAKLSIPVGHIEAGLRSFDRSMPEEVNRIVTDQLSNLLFIHSPEARTNLLREGCAPERIHAIGNTMIDTLVAMRPRVRALDVAAAHGLPRDEYLLVTLHRPALVDGPMLPDAMTALDRVAADLPVVFPMHPRTANAMRRQGIPAPGPGVRVLEPLGYMEFLSLLESAAGVVTDSGGIQEESTYLGVPCFTLRGNTERPVTCDLGTNTLLGLAPHRIIEVPERVAAARRRARALPPGWDGAAAERIVAVLDAGVPEWQEPPPPRNDASAAERGRTQSAA